MTATLRERLLENRDHRAILVPSGLLLRLDECVEIEDANADSVAEIHQA